MTRFFSCVYVLSCFLTLAIATSTVHAVVLVADGESSYVIVGNPKDAAVQDLQKYIEKMSGAKLHIIAADGVPIPAQSIFVHTEDSQSLGRQDYRLQVEGSAVHIHASSETGASHGIYGLLEDYWGCRFFTPNDEYIPSFSQLVLPDQLNKIFSPSIRDRLPGPAPYTSISNRDWRRRNRVSAQMSGHAVHNGYHYLSPKQFFEPHPEWYPLNKQGKRAPGNDWYCWTNEQMVVAMTEKVMEIMAKTPADKLISVSQGDGFSHPCFCEPCRALVEQYGSEAAPQIWGLNRVLQKTTTLYPNHQIVTFAYDKTSLPPIKGDHKLQPHRALHFTFVRTGDAMKTLSPLLKERIEGWASLTPNINIWSWSVGFKNSLCPFPNYYALAQDTKWYAGKVQGVMHQLYAGGEWSVLREWLFAKLAWDASLDIEATEKDFIQHYFGQAAFEPMWLILDTYQKLALNSNDEFNAVFGSTPANLKRKLFTPDVVEQLEGMWKQAMLAARGDEPVHAQRVADAMARSFSMLYFSDAPALKPVEINGEHWILPGGNAFLADPAERLSEILKKTILWEWFGFEMGRRLFLNNAGGKISPVVQNEKIQLAFCIALDGAMSSFVDRENGEELLHIGPRGKGQLTGLRHTVLSDKSGTEHFISTQEVDGVSSVVLSSQVVTNGWMAFNALRNERVFTLEPNQPGFTVTSSLFADSSLAGFALFSVPGFRTNTFKLYLDNPIYDTKVHMAMRVNSPSTLGVTLETPDGTQSQRFDSKPDFLIPLPAQRSDDGLLKLRITGVSSDKVLAITTPWKDWLSAALVYDATRSELILTFAGPVHAAVKDVRVPTGKLTFNLLKPEQVSQVR